MREESRRTRILIKEVQLFRLAKIFITVETMQSQVLIRAFA